MCILHVLALAYSEGFNSERVQSVLHQVELGVKHQSSNFGLGIITVSQFASVFMRR